MAYPSERERAIRDHQAWLGYLQPDGLVVSAAALVDAQVILNTRAIETQQRFKPFVEKETNPDDDTDRFLIRDFPDFCRQFFEWPDDILHGLDDVCPLPESLSIALPELHELLEPTFAIEDPKPKDADQPWLMLVKVLDAGADMDEVTTAAKAGWSASASNRFERLLRETRVPIGLLANGTHIRLIYAPRGENSGSLTFPVHAMTEVAGRPILAALHELLSVYRLLSAPSEARLPALLQRSREYQASVSTALAQQVIDAAFDLLRGLQSADERAKGALLKPVLEKDPNLIYQGLLTVLMRLVFLLYAEDRGLMPGGSLYQQHYAIHGLFERLRADAERYPDTMDSRHGAWAQLLAVFRAIHGGCQHPSLHLPAREGYLFDPDRFPFLEGRADASHDEPPQGGLPLIPDGTIFRALKGLLLLNGERLSYRTLDVEQIGSVYEVMMGFGVGIAEGPSIAIKPKKRHGAPTPINLEELLAQRGKDRAKWLKAATDQMLPAAAAAAMKEASSIDDLLAALEKRIARSSTPAPVPKGGLLLIPSDERRRSGSNYTPRSLTEPIVRKTLEPILKRLADDASEQGISPEQILDLKVCDPAMGSGAFLVEACRQLAEELVEAWGRHGRLPAIPPDEDELLYAKREIAQRCLYGVDKNPMAADLAKLSMWLTTLAKDHPFTFLDHSFRSGDSLVGLTKTQIASFTWEPGCGLQKQIWATLIEPRIEAALAARREILNAGDYLNPETKRQKLAVADERLDLVRFIGDLAVAAFFAGAKVKQRKEKRQEFLQLLNAYLGDRSKLGSAGTGAAGDTRKRPQEPVNALKEGEKGITPFHWEIEFPEVFARNNLGFDAIVGNPPFLGGTRISEVVTMTYFQWLVEFFPPCEHHCDLVAFFLRRSFAMLRGGSCFGLIATNTVAQGDTREGGLATLIRKGGCIYAATRRYRWPGEAAVVVSVVHICKGQFDGPYFLDGKPASRISAYLFDGPNDDSPCRLGGSPYFSLGSKIYGQGFLFADDDPDCAPLSERERLIHRHPDWADRMPPYLVGEEVNSDPLHRPTRFVISLSDIQNEASLNAWPELRTIVETKVKPKRVELGSNPNNVPLKRRWWAYQAHRPELYNAVSKRSRALCLSRVGQALAFVFAPTNIVYSEAVVVFDIDDDARFAIMQSRVHELWVRFFASSLEDRLRYTPSDCFETFPFAEHLETDPRLEATGEEYYEFRAALMVRNNEGLTKTYNRFHDPEEASSDILKLRELHAAMDRAVLDAYGWTDIPTDCQFLLDYEEEDEDDTGRKRKKRKPWRYRWPDDVRDVVLARLLAENAKRAEQERLAGTAPGSKDKAAKKAGKKGSRKRAEPKGQLKLGEE